MRLDARVRTLVLFALAALGSSLVYGGEINIFYKDLNGQLSLTTEQGGVEVGGPSCDQKARTCSLFLDHQFGDDFPAQDLIAGVEQLYSQQQGFFPSVFTDLVTYHAVNFEGEAGDMCDPQNNEPLDCADITITFYSAPFDALLSTPVFQQPPADGIEHELSQYFENHALNNNIVVGLPPAAIHVFVTADGVNVPTPEPSTVSLFGSGAPILAFLLRRRRG
jgi:hypothetical protein